MKPSNLLKFTLCLLPAGVLLALVVIAPQMGVLQAGAAAPALAAAPWRVFTPATNTLPMDANLLPNPGFESGSAITATAWNAYMSGYAIDATGGRGGGRALRLTAAADGESHGAYQVITLNQTQTMPIYLSGWSRTDGMSGETDAHYSVYLDIYYVDETPLHGQSIAFDVGAHDWQFREKFIAPAKPIKSINVYVLLRNTHVGTAWFDDLSIRPVHAEIAYLDGVHVATMAPDPLPYGGPGLSLATDDGLSLTLAADGGAVTAVSLAGAPVQDAARAYMSGFFVRDVAAQSDYYHVGGSVNPDGRTLVQAGALPALSLDFGAVYTAAADRITIHAELTGTDALTRALTLYFALPVSATNWTWGDDIRTGRAINGANEFANFNGYHGLGANGHLSKYPWASLSGPDGGLALGTPLDSPRAFRLIYNPATHQFYAAFDLGLSPLTNQFPNRAWVDLILYRTEAGGGFRAAAQGYYDRFPQAFARRIPPEQEGIWVAFSDVAPITDVNDFGIKVHEIGGLSYVASDDDAGILSFRYVSEPWSHWLPITTTSVDVNDYDQVMTYLHDQHQHGSTAQRRQAEATLSSGFFDENGRYRYESSVEPWCDGVGGCAVFTLNPDPDIADAAYPLNQGRLDWNATTQAAYTSTPGLDGEYIDSYLARATDMDFRATHFAATDTPLTFRTGDLQVGIPEVFATTEFARWLTQDVHQRFGKYTMANGILLDMPWGGDLFDFMGQETNWLYTGSFTPPTDARMNYYRALSYQRPYGFLMNTDFANLSHALVERYFQVCLFYGIYPSMFSANAATNRYWDDPALYNRDRPLFQRYIPLIRRLNTAGWQPLTYATTSDAQVYIERFGAWPNLHFTLRNTTDAAAAVTVTLQADALHLPDSALTGVALLSGAHYAVGAGAAQFQVTLGPQASEIIALSRPSGHALYLPLVLRDAPGGSLWLAPGASAPEIPAAVAAAVIYVDGSLANNCTGGTYSVANRDCSGSDGNAYTSIEEGVNAALPGDTVQVRGGLYHEQVDIRVNGEAGNRIVIQNYPGETPILEGSQAVTGWAQCSGDDPYLTVQGEVNPHYAAIYRTAVDALPESQSPNVEHLVVLYENGEFMLPAQDPDQSMIIQNQKRYIPIEEESVGLTDYLIDSAHLTQPDNYWAGASVWVWVHAENNNIQSRVITASNQSQHSITFDAPLSAPLSVSGFTNPDAYSIYNHPHLLDQPGEYFYTPQPDGDGHYWLYIWPRNTSDLADKIRINHEQMGFFPRQTFGSYVTIDGFEIRGFSGNWTRNGGVVIPYGFEHSGFQVKHCNIHHNYGDGITIYQGVDDLIEGNTVDTNFGAGLEGMRHTHLVVKDNVVRNHEGTNVSFDVNEHMEIVGNRIGGFLGTHGNGMAIYDGCNDVLVAGNIIAIERNVPLTFNTMGNLVLYNNILYSGDSTRIIASWSMGTGYHLAFNNLILGADTEGAAYFRTAGNKVFRNNIVDGGRLVGDGGSLESTHNLYTTFAWDQPDLNPTEIDGREVNKADLFADYAALDFHLKPGSPARDAGVSADDIIQAYGLQTLFPSYNFYADMDGNSRPVAGAWDLGPYRFTPSLELQGIAGDRAIRLDWTVNVTMPATTTWAIAYQNPGSAYLPITGILSPTRAYTLTNLTNGIRYTVTLSAMLDDTAWLSDTVAVTPTGIRVYLPLVLR